jgi:hypothetical protein
MTLAFILRLLARKTSTGLELVLALSELMCDNRLELRDAMSVMLPMGDLGYRRRGIDSQSSVPNTNSVRNIAVGQI